MKILISALMLFCLSHAAGLSAAPLFVYNHGYVLGELNNVELIGINRRVVGGAVSIGRNSFGGGVDAGDEWHGDFMLQNPWNFCADLNFYDNLVARMGEYVVIEYRTPKKSSLLQCPWVNEFIDAYPVSRGNPSSQVRESAKIVASGKPYGVSAGRIVNVQKSDKYNDNWSIVIQTGNGGNDFRYLQIIDADLYAFALECLASATRVQLYHIEQIRGVAGSNRSDTFVWKIETRPDLW